MRVYYIYMYCVLIKYTYNIICTNIFYCHNDIIWFVNDRCSPRTVATVGVQNIIRVFVKTYHVPPHQRWRACYNKITISWWRKRLYIRTWQWAWKMISMKMTHVVCRIYSRMPIYLEVTESAGWTEFCKVQVYNRHYIIYMVS